MANEFKHKDPGSELTQAEFIASDGTGHIFDSQASGDILYASSTTVLARLAKATDGNVLELASGLPAWTGSPNLTALTVDDVAVDGKVITMTGSSGDTAVFTVGTNGTLSLVTVDTAAAAANIQITADGTVDIDSAGVLTLDSGAAINIEPAAGSAVLLDGTVSIDGGAVTGVTDLTASGALSGATVAGNMRASAAQTTTGTSADLAVTPDGLAGSVVFGTRYVQMVVVDFTTDIAEGNGKFYLHIPAGLNGMDLVEVHAKVITVGSGSTVDVQVHNLTDGSDMLSTSLTIDDGELDSKDAATAAVINGSEDDIVTNDVLRIDVDGNGGDSTVAKGLIVTLGFRIP